MHMFGICDGHGTNGRDAANFVKYAMHLQIEQKINKWFPRYSVLILEYFWQALLYLSGFHQPRSWLLE